MTFQPPERFNLADYLLDERIREGRSERTAIVTDLGRFSYGDVQALANRYGNLLLSVGIRPEQRVLLALQDGPDLVGALFATVKIGAVAVMVNPYLKPEEIGYFYEYTRARAALVDHERAQPFRLRAGRWPEMLLEVGSNAVQEQLATQPDTLETYPSHRDDAVIWLFSGGTTGRPKAVIQTHASFANTTECYGKKVLGITETDVTIAVPKLFFGYATGSNLFFPFSVGASAVLFPQRCTAEALFTRIATHGATVLVNVPTMINQMLSTPDAARRDLSSLRVSTSAGEALPPELHARWNRTFGVELLDGLGTAEMWHIFVSNRPGAVRPGTLGTVVPGFEVRVCDDEGRELADGEVGALWVRGNSRALGYWQQMEKTREAFRGEWYISDDMIRRDADGYITHCGRADDMLKVSGRWLAPGEVENCLLEHPDVAEAVVVGVTDGVGLTVPQAFVVPRTRRDTLADELCAWVGERIGSYKQPRRVEFLAEFPRTHLGKVDRGRLRAAGQAAPQA